MTKSSELICSRCKKKKSFDDFHKSNTEASGRKSACKDCLNKVSRKYIRKIDPIVRRNRHLLRNYGITLKEFNNLLKIQRGRCCICVCLLNKASRPHIDHSHKTGEVRGILCQNCNHLLGNAKDNIKILLAAIRYLENKNSQTRS